MRIVCLCNNWLGWQVLEWLKRQEDPIVALVVHPTDQAKYLREIQEVVQGSNCRIFSATELNDPAKLQEIRALNPDTAVSALFAYVLRKEFLALFPRGCVNLHPALLPYNRGVYPNVWSIVDKTPSGVTLHFINEGIDTGDIIAQKNVPVSPLDTGASLYRKLETAMIDLFRECWPAIRSGEAKRQPQDRQAGTFHRYRDVDKIDEIDLQRSYIAEDLLNVIRARTFSPYPGAYFRDGKKKIYLRLELIEEDETTKRDETLKRDS